VLGGRTAQVGGATGSRRDRDKHHDGKIHVSTLHECPRQVQLRFRGATPTDEVIVKLNLRAQFGTAIHDRFLALWAEQFADDPEVDEVLYDDAARSTEILVGPIVAHPDLLVVYTDGTFLIGELKTTHKTAVHAAKNNDIRRSHLDQCRVAGLIAEAQSGMPMRGYLIYYIDTEHPETNFKMARRPWTEAEINAAHEGLDRAVSLAGPDTAPRWFGKHEGDAFAPHSPCISCEFKSGCLGKDADDPLRQEAAAELVDAGVRFGEQVRQAQDDLMEFLRLKGMVDKPKRDKGHVTEVAEHLGLQPGPYQVGDVVHKLEWRPGYDKDDGVAAARMLRDLKKDVPQTWVKGHFRFT
jgi:hypothetical protein